MFFFFFFFVLLPPRRIPRRAKGLCCPGAVVSAAAAENSRRAGVRLKISGEKERCAKLFFSPLPSPAPPPPLRYLHRCHPPPFRARRHLITTTRPVAPPCHTRGLLLLFVVLLLLVHKDPRPHCLGLTKAPSSAGWRANPFNFPPPAIDNPHPLFRYK